MVANKSPEQIKQTVLNVAKSRGISEQQLQSMLSSVGISL